MSFLSRSPLATFATLGFEALRLGGVKKKRTACGLRSLSEGTKKETQGAATATPRGLPQQRSSVILSFPVNVPPHMAL